MADNDQELQPVPAVNEHEGQQVSPGDPGFGGTASIADTPDGGGDAAPGHPTPEGDTAHQAPVTPTQAQSVESGAAPEQGKPMYQDVPGGPYKSTPPGVPEPGQATVPGGGGFSQVHVGIPPAGEEQAAPFQAEQVPHPSTAAGIMQPAREEPQEPTSTATEQR